MRSPAFSSIVGGTPVDRRITNPDSLLPRPENRRTDAHHRRAFQYRLLEIVRHAHGKRIERVAAGDEPVLQFAQPRKLTSPGRRIGRRRRNGHQAAQPQPGQPGYRLGEREFFSRRNAGFALFAAHVHLYADIERGQGGGPRLVQTLGDPRALDPVYPLEMLRDGTGLVALDRADEVPLEQEAFRGRPVEGGELRDFFHTLLRLVLSERALTAGT